MYRAGELGGEQTVADAPVDPRIVEEARRIIAGPGVRAVLLAGGRVTGQTWPGADVDLLAITEYGPTRTDVVDVEWTTFDTTYTTMLDLEDSMVHSFITCNACLHLVTVGGEPDLAPRFEARARRLYRRHIPGPEELEEYRARVRTAGEDACVALGHGDAVAAAQAGGELVWHAGRICLAMAGLGPVREDQWHDVLRAAHLPFDAATLLAEWLVGAALEDRLAAAFTLADRALGQALPRAPRTDTLLPSPPQVQRRAVPEAAEAMEMHRLIQAVGFGKMAKAEWLGDRVRQASELGVILWFALPALLALGGVAAPDQSWPDAALCRASLPHGAAALYARALTAPVFEQRKAAAMDLGRSALEFLETIFSETAYADKYRRAPHGPGLLSVDETNT
jgi:hypothetical protein